MAVIVVSGPFPVPLGLRFQQPVESEIPCALALLGDPRRSLERRTFDILVPRQPHPHHLSRVRTKRPRLALLARLQLSIRPLFEPLP